MVFNNSGNSVYNALRSFHKPVVNLWNVLDRLLYLCLVPDDTRWLFYIPSWNARQTTRRQQDPKLILWNFYDFYRYSQTCKKNLWITLILTKAICTHQHLIFVSNIFYVIKHSLKHERDFKKKNWLWRKKQILKTPICVYVCVIFRKCHRH